MRPYIRASLLATLVLGAACNKGRTDDAASGTAAGTVEQPLPPASTLRVTDVVLGRGMQGDTALTDETDDFRVNDAIHALVKHEGAATGATITARWTFQDGQVVDERTETITTTGAATQYTHFTISKPSGFPKGKYKLQILLNGAEVESEEFEVK